MLISWPAILAFVSFWSYGFFASAHASSRLGSVLLPLLVAGLTAGFAALPPKSEFFADRWEIGRRDLAAFLLYAALLSLLAGSSLLGSLEGDQLFHAQYSQVHAQKAIRFLGLQRGLFLSTPFRTLLWAADLMLLTAGLLTLLLVRKLSHRNRWITVGLLTLAFRFGVDRLGGNLDPHPAFRLFPLWLSSTMLSCTDFAFRLPQFLALAALCVFLYRKGRVRLHPAAAALFALSAGTLPVLLHVATLAEPSIWSACTWTVVLFSLPDVYETPDEADRKRLWFRLSALLALGTMMRQPTFVAFIPFFIAMLLRERKRVLHFWPVALPFFLLVPQTLWAILYGTPAIQPAAAWAAHSITPGVVSAIQSGAALNAIQHSLFAYGELALMVAFIPLVSFIPALAAIRGLWFAVAIGTFFSITPHLWGVGRYQAEYAAPFVIFGVYQLLIAVGRLAPFASFALPAAVIVLNCYYYRALPELNAPVDARNGLPPSEIRIFSELQYEFGQAYSAVQKQGLAGATYFAGLGYGNFTAILSGYSLGDWLKEFEILNQVTRHKQDRGRPTLGYIHSSDILSDPRIRAVILSDEVEEEGSDVFRAALHKGGFEHREDFKNIKYGSTVSLWAKSR